MLDNNKVEDNNNDDKKEKVKFAHNNEAKMRFLSNYEKPNTRKYYEAPPERNIDFDSLCTGADGGVQSDEIKSFHGR
jgi:hypothetical protein